MNRLLLTCLAVLSCSSCMRFVYVPAPGLVIGEPTRVRTMREGRALAAAYRRQLEVDGTAARRRYAATMREVAPSATSDSTSLSAPPLVPLELPRKPLQPRDAP